MVARLRAHGTDCREIEAKAATTALPKSVAESIRAVADGAGGTLILGLKEDEGFAATGVVSPAKVRDDLASLCADAFDPPVRAEIDIVDFEDVQLVTAVVPEAPALQKLRYVRARGLEQWTACSCRRLPD